MPPIIDSIQFNSIRFNLIQFKLNQFAWNIPIKENRSKVIGTQINLSTANFIKMSQSVNQKLIFFGSKVHGDGLSNFTQK